MPRLWFDLWEPGHAEAIVQAIRRAELGVAPAVVSGAVRVAVPRLTHDQRKEAAKQVTKHGEEAHVAVRSALRDGGQAVGSEEAAGLQGLADECHAQIRSLVADKEKALGH
ncbi:ribosome-recycling factor (plasmid) [Streptomyces cavourensis]